MWPLPHPTSSFLLELPLDASEGGREYLRSYTTSEVDIVYLSPEDVLEPSQMEIVIQQGSRDGDISSATLAEISPRTYDLSVKPPPDWDVCTATTTPALTPAVSSEYLSKQFHTPTSVEDQEKVPHGEIQHLPHLVQFSENDPRDPHNASAFARNFLFLTISINAFLVTAFSSAYLDLIPDMMEAFDSSRTVVITGFVVYVVGWGPGPLFLAPLSDSIGRKPVYIASSLLWTLFHIGCAFAPDAKTMIICRLCASLFGSASTTNGSGSIVDMFEGDTITKRTNLYVLIDFIGPSVGPLIGASIAARYPPTVEDGRSGYRCLFLVAAHAGLFITLMHCLTMETHHGIILQKSAKRLNKQYGTDKFHVAVVARERSLPAKIGSKAFDSIKMIVQEPIILFVAIWQATVNAVIYLAFDAFPVIFGTGHGFTSVQVALCFLSSGIGMVLACLWSNTSELKSYKQRVSKAQGLQRPEMRIPQGLIGAILAVAGLLWTGYTSYPSLHWILPIIGFIVYGLGAFSVLLATFVYTMDSYTKRAAPVFAALSFVRCTVSGLLPLGGAQFFENLDARNAALILACISLLEIGIPLAGIKWGRALRIKSKYAVSS
ncbi:unnamed protein product [Sympodiomycopsis kandeliae]